MRRLNAILEILAADARRAERVNGRNAIAERGQIGA